jgi:glycine/D-amino acid oxidase-like deaminating enzyme
MAKKHFIVIGSGILGASIAWHLSAAGAAVTILEAGRAGGRATRDSWAWINASWGNPEPYFHLRQRAMQEWQRLAQQVPDVGLDWCGGLIWDLPPDQLEAFAKEHSAWGYQLERIDGARALQIEPGIRQAPDYALHMPQEGKVEPLGAALALLAAAQRLGARLEVGSPVISLLQTDGRVTGVRTNDALLQADEVVIAAGIGSVGLLRDFGLLYSANEPAGLLVHSKPTRRLLNSLLMTPELHVRQTSKGRLVAGTDFVGSMDGTAPDVLASRLYQKVQAMVAGSEDVALDFYTLGQRPTPADGFPMVGRPKGTAGLYLVLSHSGITLAPALGLFSTQELLNGLRDPLLANYHPDRLLQAAA